MIRYDRLWKTMEQKGLTQYRLIKNHGFSAGQVGRLKRNMHVSTHTLETLCTILGCRIEDVVEFVPDQMEALAEAGALAQAGSSQAAAPASPAPADSSTETAFAPAPDEEEKSPEKKSARKGKDKAGKEKKSGKSKKGKGGKKK